MRKIIILIVFVLLFSSIALMSNLTYATNQKLITNAKIKYEYRLNNSSTSRVRLMFELGESIDLSQEKSDIIIEYFTKNNNGTITAINNSTSGGAYVKDKSWVGYLNSYENYPEGELKYSNGNTQDARYLDLIPSNKEISTQITNSTKIDVEWSQELVLAIRITVYRADGSGEKVMVYSDGTKSVTEKIHAPIAPVREIEPITGIRLESTTQIPENTQLVAERIENSALISRVNNTLSDIQRFVVYEISLEANGIEIQPNGKVRIGIPIPEDFNNSNVVVYRIEENGENIAYDVTLEELDGKVYAKFETDHFSTYILAEEVVNLEGKKDDTPKTGTAENIYYIISIMIVISIGILSYGKIRFK